MDHAPYIDPRPAMRAKAEADGIDRALVERFLTKTEFDPETGCLKWVAATTKGAALYSELKALGWWWGGTRESIDRAKRYAEQSPHRAFVSTGFCRSCTTWSWRS